MKARTAASTSRSAGITLTEILISILILGVGLVSLATLFPIGLLRLREAQRHALLLARKRAATRLAMFLELLERLQITRGEPASEIHLPMGRSSIAAYLGLTPAALSRALHTLTASKIISARDRRHIKILDRAAFQKLADTRNGEG